MNLKGRKQMKQPKHMNFGKALEDVIKLKEKAEVKSKHSKEDYTRIAIVTAERVNKQLTQILNGLHNDTTIERKISAANQIFKILVVEDYSKLIKEFEDFEYWNDLNNKLNS